MTRMPSIVGVAVDNKTDKILYFVGNLNEVRQWAREISGPEINIQIREIGEIVMYMGEVKS